MAGKEQEDVVVFFFRRDLRIQDNMGLIQAIKYCKKKEYKLICCFTLTHEQLEIEENPYFSHNAVQFMMECLTSLYGEMDDKLVLYKGSSIDFLKEMSNKHVLKAVFFNKDYTPYARNRDNEIIKWCGLQDYVEVDGTTEDYTLLPLETVKSATNNSPYKIFSFFYKTAIEIEVKKPVVTNAKDLKEVCCFIYNSKKTLKPSDLSDFYHANKKLIVKGGREHALSKLKEIEKGVYNKYERERDYPNLEKTTLLSAYLKFGCCSIREAYYVMKKKYGQKHVLLKQLYWKEFYANIAYHYPHVLDGMIKEGKGDNIPMKREMVHKIVWENNAEWFDKWCRGDTGFPMVDAGMRQLNETGFMHNRLRMITSGFLVKDLHIDWRKGERYFSSKLVDYDPASNNGGWQWSAGTGTDSQPYNRIFNPWTQIERFDKDCKYIKKWILELEDVPPTDIRKWNTKSIQSKHKHLTYAKPIVDHNTQRKKYLDEIYKK